MTHKLIKTDNYLLVVDDSEIKQSDWIYNEEREPSIVQCIGKGSLRGWAKVIFHLPLNNAPILEGVDLLPPLEDDVEAKGYTKAKEKYRYTEEDLRKAFQCGQQWVHEITNTDKDPTNFNELIQSLQQPKCPVAFECEIELYDEGGFSPERKPKAITNSQGQTQLVGTYKY